MMRPNWGYIGRAPSGEVPSENSGYVYFGIVVACSDEGPIGRASAALKDQLPTCFPATGLSSSTPSHVIPEMADKLLFRVLGRTTKFVSKVPAHDLVLTIQAAVDDIVVERRLGA
jgi:hypothetical protein